MELVHSKAEAYAHTVTMPTPGVLQQVYHQSLSHSHAHMLSSEVQGSLLAFMSQLLQPKYILEIGTFTGYSALCLCTGLQPCGELHTIELRQEDADRALSNFKLAGVQNRIHLHIGHALDIIPRLEPRWDLVFIDADKTNYTAYYELVIERLQEQGMIIADNVLFHGQVLEDTIKGKNAKAMHAFNQHVAGDTRSDQVLLTVRDGLLFIKKKNTSHSIG